MILRCVGRYRSSAGAWNEGDEIHCTEEFGAFLLRDAPTSFVVNEVPASETVGDSAAVDLPVAEPPDLSAMSTETQSGLVVPDRRARGGKKRGT